MARTIEQTNTYTEKLVKLIPTEWVSAYVAIKGILDSVRGPHLAYYMAILALLVLLPLYLRRVLHVQAVNQIAMTMGSFVVWVFSLGGDHVGTIWWYEPYQGSIGLILWTLVIPIVAGQHGGDLLTKRAKTT